MTARIFLDTKDYEKGVGDAQKDTNDFASRLRSGLGTAAKVAGVAVTATAAATTFLTKKVVQGTQETAAYGNEIDKMSQKLGLSKQAYQEWDYVLGQADVDINSMQVGLKTLTNQIDDAKNGSADAAARFEKLGISLDDLNTMSREDIFAATIKGFQGMADSTERAALANDLYGKSGQNLTPLFNETAEATEELRQKAHDLGMVMSDEAVEASAAYNDSLDTLKRTTTGLKNNFMSEFLPSLTTVMDGLSDIFAGKDSGIGKVGKGFDEFVKNLNKQLPKVIKVGSKIVVQLVKSISDNLPDLANAALEAVNSFVVDGILPNLPKIIDSGLKMLLALAKGLADNVGKITQTLVKVVVDIAKTLTNPKSIKELVKAATKMMVELGKGLISAIPELVSAIPEIVLSIVTGLIGGIQDAANDVGRALFGIVDQSKEYSKSIETNASKTRAFRDSLKDIQPTLADYDKLLSSSGKSLSDLDTEIGEIESKVTDILRKEFEEQGTLRAQDKQDLEEYVKRIRELELEKLGIYQGQQQAEYIKTQKEMGKLDQKQAEQRMKNAEEARKKSDESAEKIYTAEITRAENERKANIITAEAYDKRIKDAQRSYNVQRKDNEKYYNDTAKLVEQESERWVKEDAKKYEALSKHQFAFTNDTQKTFANLGFGANLVKWLDLDRGEREYKKALSSLDTTTANSFLKAAISIKKQGEPIKKETKEIAKTILSAFKGLPDYMQEDAKNALLGLIAGMEEEIPELANASEMTAGEIINVLENNLDIKGGSSGKVGKIGKDTVKNLAGGLGSQNSLLKKSTGEVIDAIKNPFSKSTGSFYSMGGDMALGVGRGFRDSKSAVQKMVNGALSSVLAGAKKLMGIASPSKVFRDIIGVNMAKGVGVGWDDAFGDVQKDVIGSMSGLVDDADMPLDFGGNYDTSIVSRETGATGGFGAQIVAALDEYFPELIDTIARLKVYLDTGALVGEMTPLLDRSLGQESVYRRRAN